MGTFIQKGVRDIIKEVALKTNLPIKSVEDIIISEFEFVRSEMQKGVRGDESSFKSILLKYLGTFAFHRDKHMAIEYNIKKVNEEHNRELQSEE